MIYVVKGGGDVNKDGENLIKFAKFVLANPYRRVVVVSAPGSTEKYPTKLTKILFQSVGMTKEERWAMINEVVRKRFLDITKHLGIDFSILEPSFEHLYNVLESFDERNSSHIDELKFFGERCQQYICAEAIKNQGGKAVVKTPWDLGVILEELYGVMRFSPTSYRFIRKVFKEIADDEIMVTGGFGGYDLHENLRTLPFGGTDVSAAHIARALNADLYENVKIVDGYANIDPKLVKGSPLEKILIHYDRVKFDEAIEASKGGAEVIHAHALRPCRGNKGYKEIPIRVCNLEKPDEYGTLITDKEESIYTNACKFITMQDGIYLVTIEDDNMIDARSYAGEVKARLGARDIPYDHDATSENSLVLAIHKDNFDSDETRLQDYAQNIETFFPGAKVSYRSGISMITVVNRIKGSGEGTPGILAKTATALYRQDINIDFVTQAQEKAIRLGVSSERAVDGVKVILKEFWSDEQYLPKL